MRRRSRFKRLITALFLAAAAVTPFALCTGGMLLDGVPRDGGMAARPEPIPVPAVDPDTPGGRFLAALDRAGITVPGRSDKEKIQVGESVCTALYSLPYADYSTVVSTTKDATGNRASAIALVAAATTWLCPL